MPDHLSVSLKHHESNAPREPRVQCHVQFLQAEGCKCEPAILICGAGPLARHGHHIRHSEVDAISLASLTARE